MSVSVLGAPPSSQIPAAAANLNCSNSAPGSAGQEAGASVMEPSCGQACGWGPSGQSAHLALWLPIWAQNWRPFGAHLAAQSLLRVENGRRREWLQQTNCQLHLMPARIMTNSNIFSDMSLCLRAKLAKRASWLRRASSPCCFLPIGQRRARRPIEWPTSTEQPPTRPAGRIP